MSMTTWTRLIVMGLMVGWMPLGCGDGTTEADRTADQDRAAGRTERAAPEDAAGDAPEPAAAPGEHDATDNPRVVLDTSLGEIVLELDAEKAPVTVANFLEYVDDGFYAGTIFHRVIPGFMIQGGGFTGPAEQKTEGLRPPIQNEAANGLKNRIGTIAMARTGAPHSATAQFFINVGNNTMLDHPGHDGWGYCVFGRVVEGMDVVERIRDVQVQRNPMMPNDPPSLPLDPPVIRQATRR